LGNRISCHKYRQASAIGYAHDKANRMTTLANRTQEHDLAGNLTLAFSVDRGTSYKYKYDHHNRLRFVWASADPRILRPTRPERRHAHDQHRAVARTVPPPKLQPTVMTDVAGWRRLRMTRTPMLRDQQVGRRI
jgi:hypothetical protein